MSTVELKADHDKTRMKLHTSQARMIEKTEKTEEDVIALSNSEYSL